MEPNTHTALFTTASAVVGGVSKAIAAKVLLIAVTIPGLVTVILYASASAAAGYVVKKVLDACTNRINQFFKHSNKKTDE